MITIHSEENDRNGKLKYSYRMSISVTSLGYSINQMHIRNKPFKKQGRIRTRAQALNDRMPDVVNKNARRAVDPGPQQQF